MMQRFHPVLRTVGVWLIFLLSLLAGCEPANQVRVERITPENPVPRESNLTIQFSQDMVLPDRVDQPFDSAALNLDPPHPGWFRWIDTRSLQFMPTRPFLPSTRYTLSIEPEIVELPELHLGGQRRFDLQTATFSLLAIHPLVRPSRTDPNRSIVTLRLQFSEEVAPEAVLEHVRIYREDINRAVDYSLTDHGVTREFTLVTGEIPRPEKEDVDIRIEVDAALQCVSGNIPLGGSRVETITLDKLDELKVNRIAPNQQDNEFSIAITLSIPVDPSEVKDYIELSPEQEYEVMSGYSNQVIISGDFEQNESVRVTLKQGLPALNGKTLIKEFTRQVTFPQLRPAVNFSSPGMYLARSGLRNVQLDVINLDSIRVEIAKIYPNNLVAFLHDGPYYYQLNKYGTTLHNESIRIESPDGGALEVPTPVTVNFASLLREHSTGLFYMTVRDDKQYWRKDSRTILLTDIGLIAKQSDDDLHIWALSTTSLDPISGVSLRLYSYNNQVMGRATTDASGRAVITGLNRQSNEFTPFVITAEKGADYSFLNLNEQAIVATHFDVGGMPVKTEGFDAWLYGDRDVYRPGETAHIAAVVRAVRGATPDNFPVTLKITDPSGRTVFNQKGRLNSEGMVAFDVSLDAFARTGRYSAALYTSGDRPDDDYSFLVEEFMPDRIKAELELNSAKLEPGDTLRATVTGTMLFGPPAAGRRSEVTIDLNTSSFAPEKWSDYSFGDPDREFSSVTEKLGEEELDEEGRATYEYVVPSSLRPPAALQGTVQATVYETGGRAVSTREAVTVYPYPNYIGIKRQNNGHAEPNRKETFQVVVVDPDGEAADKRSLSVRYIKYRWQTTLRQGRRGNYRYGSERIAETLSREELAFSGSPATIAFTPPTWGQYAVEITDSRSGAITTVRFYAGGWGYSPWAMQHPDRIELELDRDSYQVGQNVKVLVKAPFSGKLLLTVERDKVLYSRQVSLEENTAEITLPVRREFQPNAYVIATLVRSGREVDPQAPMRAYGAVPLMLDMSGYRLGLAISAPETMRPNNPLEVTVTARGGANGMITLAAVDEGILQLTNYKTPDPHNHFYGKKQLDVLTFDLFQSLLPEAEKALIHSSPSGGKSAADMGHVSALSQHRVKPVALWSGLVSMRNGRAKVTLDVPEFNGRLRLMAVAVDGDRYDNAHCFVQVRDPIVLTPTLPRFAAGGDEFEVPVNVFNGLGKATDITVDMSLDGPLSAEGDTKHKVRVEPDREGRVVFRVKAERAHDLATVTFTAKGGGVSVTSETTLPVRPPTQPESRTGSGMAQAGKPFTVTMPGDLVSGTDSYTLHAMSLPTLQYAGGLEYLLRYPHGCLEQTTSGAMPLLYFNTLARQIAPDRFDDNAPEYYVQEAINRIISMQLRNGGFDFWPGSQAHRVNAWASIYAGHFLVEAAQLGYNVPHDVLKDLRRFLQDVTDGDHDYDNSWYKEFYRGSRYSRTEKYNLRIRAYALFVLALMEEPERGAMNRFKRDKLTDCPEDAKALLAGAFALSGDQAAATDLLPDKAFSPTRQPRESGYTFASDTRVDAVTLYILARFEKYSPVIPALVQRLNESMDRGRWYTTQDNAWALLALGRLYHESEQADYTGKLLVDGKPVGKAFDESPYTFSDPELAGKEVAVEIEGKGACYVYWEARGLPQSPQFEEIHQGVEVRRSYKSYEGASISLEQIEQGDLVVVELRIKNTGSERALFNLLVDDMLPAGLEVENPRLASRERLTWIPSKGVLNPASMDIRDDRVLLYLDLYGHDEETFYYSARAVTRGRFTVPPVQAEAMYDPTIRSISSSGIMMVTPRE